MLRGSRVYYNGALRNCGWRQVRELERVSELIGQIYDASLDPERWPDVLGRACGFVPGHAASLFSKDVTDRSGNIYYDDRSIRTTSSSTSTNT